LGNGVQTQLPNRFSVRLESRAAALQGRLVLVLVNVCIFLGLVALIEVAATVAFALKDTDELWLLPDTVDAPYVYFSFRPNADPQRIVNQDGMATAYERQKAPGTYRVAVLGGSVARSSFASSRDATISGRLERLLRERFPTRKIEVINAGMSAYVLEQEYIFYQLSLSKYRPDLVVGLDGYNDLMAVSLNRFSGGLVGPQNYQQFQVIADGKLHKQWLGQVSTLLPNTVRALGGVKRALIQRGDAAYGALDVSYIQRAAAQYRDLLEDLQGLARHRGARYVAFLQPIRWYVPAAVSGPSAEESELVRLYRAYEESIRTVPDAYSLTALLIGKDDLYVDSAVHVGDVGNDFFAQAIADKIAPLVGAALGESGQL